MSVELRHLRSFVAVAEELNFTRAAERLHIAQQALSTHIRQLEERVGTELFVRTTRKVELTPAGAALLERVPSLLTDVDDAVESALFAAQGTTGKLVVGLCSTGMLPFTPLLVRTYRERHPGVAIELRNLDFGDPSAGVHAGEADVGLIWWPLTEDGLVVERISEEPRDAVLAVDHPLAAKEVLTAEELAYAPISYMDHPDKVNRDFWTFTDVRNGEPPNVGAYISGNEDMLAAIRTGMAASAMPRSLIATMPLPDIVTRPVDGLKPATLAICRRTDSANPHAQELLDLAVELRDQA